MSNFKVSRSDFDYIFARENFIKKFMGNCADEMIVPDIPEIGYLLQASGYRIDSIDHFTDGMCPLNDTEQVRTRVIIMCPRGKMRVVMEAPDMPCRCPGEETKENINFWKMSAQAPDNSRTESGNNIIPTAPAGVDYFIRQTLTRLINASMKRNKVEVPARRHSASHLDCLIKATESIRVNDAVPNVYLNDTLLMEKNGIEKCAMNTLKRLTPSHYRSLDALTLNGNSYASPEPGLLVKRDNNTQSTDSFNGILGNNLITSSPLTTKNKIVSDLRAVQADIQSIINSIERATKTDDVTSSTFSVHSSDMSPRCTPIATPEIDSCKASTVTRVRKDVIPKLSNTSRTPFKSKIVDYKKSFTNMLSSGSSAGISNVAVPVHASGSFKGLTSPSASAISATRSKILKKQAASVGTLPARSRISPYSHVKSTIPKMRKKSEK